MTAHETQDEIAARGRAAVEPSTWRTASDGLGLLGPETAAREEVADALRRGLGPPPLPPDRPAEIEVLLDMAEQYARRGTCSRLQVGALLVRDGRILSTGRNGAAAGLEHCTHETDEPCLVSVHAEASAIAFAARAGGGAEGATLVLTHAPCAGCAGLLINAGIARVVYRHPYRSPDGPARLLEAGVLVQHRPVKEVAP